MVFNVAELMEDYQYAGTPMDMDCCSAYALSHAVLNSLSYVNHLSHMPYNQQR